jgi:hypothetical protein
MDDQVAALRALLAGDKDLHRALFAKLDRTEIGKGYNAMVAASFAEAVLRRFGNRYTQAEIVAFVSYVRSKSAEISELLDPEAGALMINAVLDDASTQGMSRKDKAMAQILLLMALIADEHLADAGLDAFLADARKLANGILAG